MSGHVLREVSELQIGGVGMGGVQQGQYGAGNAAVGEEGDYPGRVAGMFAAAGRGRGRRNVSAVRDWVPSGAGSYNTELRWVETRWRFAFEGFVGETGQTCWRERRPPSGWDYSAAVLPYPTGKHLVCVPES